MKIDRKNSALLFILIFYAVGFVGFLTGNPDEFAKLTPINLIITGAMIFLYQGSFSLKEIIAIAVVFLSGYGIEVLGVHTGVVFGEYSYGENLGWKLFDVPLLIGLNWLVLVYGSFELARLLTNSIFLAALLGATLMTALDVIMEPVAVRLDYWTWANGEIPLQNFIAWWCTAFVLQLIWANFTGVKGNKAAILLLLLQFAFFTVLNNLL